MITPLRIAHRAHSNVLCAKSACRCAPPQSCTVWPLASATYGRRRVIIYHHKLLQAHLVPDCQSAATQGSKMASESEADATGAQLQAPAQGAAQVQPQAPVPAHMCMICGAQPHKYKCPRCRSLRYCSAACYKVHVPACAGMSTKKRPRAAGTGGSGGGAASSGGVGAGEPSRAKHPRREGRYAGGPTRGRGQGLGANASLHKAAPPEPEEGDPGYLKVTPAQLELLRRNESIRAALKDPALQELLLDIDSSGGTGGVSLRRGQANRGRLPALEAARRDNRRFAAFADDVLVTVGVCRREDDGSVVFAL